MFPVRLPRLAIGLGLILSAVVTPARSVTPAHFWSRAFGGSTGNDTPSSVAVDGVGSVIVTGTFRGSVNFGGATLVSAGSDDIFLVKYNSAGAHVWSKRFGGPGTDGGRALTVTKTGVIYLTGGHSGSTSFGGSTFASAGLEDMFWASFGTDGSHFSSLSYGGPGTDVGTSIAVDEFNDVQVCGIFEGTAFFGVGGFLTSAGSNDMFIVRYNTPSWAASYGGTNADYAADVALDAGNNVYLLGRFRDSASFGGPTLVSAGVDDVVLAKYDVNGSHVWSQRFGGINPDYANSIAIDASGLLITGQFESSVNFGGGTLTSAGLSDVFLARYTLAGAHVWSRRWGGLDADVTSSVALAPSGDAVITGWFSNTTNLGGAPLVSAGSNDAFLARYDPNGNHIWSTRFGSTSFDFGVATATGPAGDVVTAGGFFGTVNFGGSSFTSAGAMDAYVGRYGANTTEPVIKTITDIGNDQGRLVQIALRPTGFDHPEAAVRVTQYEAYLRSDALPALVAYRGAPLSASRQALLDQGWVFAAAVPASTDDAYLIEAPTDADSTIALGLHRSVFFVRAATDDPSVYYDSPPDSGYSVDNLPPPAPGDFQFGPSLSWDQSPAADFDYFSLYGSTSSVFNSSAVLITQITGTSSAPGSTSYPYYYVTATDFSGNEGNAARVVSASGVADTRMPYTLAVNAYPNPFNPRTTIRYDVPAHGRVRVRVFDASGARVATLIDQERDAGSYSVGWDGHDERGAPVGSGVYFVRLDMNGSSTTRKIALVK